MRARRRAGPSCTRLATSASTTSTPITRRFAGARTGWTTSSTATSSPDATVSMACAAPACRRAASDVKYLSGAFVEHYRERSSAGIDHYSQRCLQRVWKAERFSWWLTSLMHKFPDNGDFGQRLQEAELDYLVGSKAASTALAEN